MLGGAICASHKTPTHFALRTLAAAFAFHFCFCLYLMYGLEQHTLLNQALALWTFPSAVFAFFFGTTHVPKTSTTPTRVAVPTGVLEPEPEPKKARGRPKSPRKTAI